MLCKTLIKFGGGEVGAPVCGADGELSNEEFDGGALIIPYFFLKTEVTLYA
jgi:hypothetical protein